MSTKHRALAALGDSYRFLPPVVREALISFARRSGLAEEPADRIFEHFATYHVLRAAGLDDFDVSAAIVAGEHDTQLDAVAVTINGALVSTGDEIERLLREAIDGEPFVVRFLFAQATMSAKFPSDKVALFTSGVMNYFRPASKLKQSAPLERSRALKDRVLEALETLGQGLPTADVYVVWPGTWTTEGHSEHATGVAEAGLETLQATKQLERVRFHRIDSTRLQSLIVEDAVANAADLELQGLTESPPVPGIPFAAIGFVCALDYLACISDRDPASPNAVIKEDAFHGNVRAFLGPDLPVNKHIRDSFVGADGAAQAEFALRNNGVTIIAASVERIAGSNRLHLRNFQVVNGCQTSHVLFHNREYLTRALLLPIKIIATEDPAIAQNIILGLNRQTQIDELQILARNEFVRRMKRHFDVTSAIKPLWIDGIRTPMVLFERRTGEFAHIPPEFRTRVVTMQELMQAYAAAFLESPHSVHEGGKAYLIRQVPARMFADNHDVGFYFASALLLWRARGTFTSMKEWQFYPAKHQLLFALRTLADPPGGCPGGRRDGEAHEYLKAMRHTLFDDSRAGRLAAQARAIIDEAARAQAAAEAQMRHAEPPDPATARLTGNMAQRESFSDRVLSLCLAART